MLTCVPARTAANTGKDRKEKDRERERVPPVYPVCGCVYDQFATSAGDWVWKSPTSQRCPVHQGNLLQYCGMSLWGAVRSCAQ